MEILKLDGLRKYVFTVLVVGMLAAVLLPLLDRALGNTSGPTAITLRGVGLILGILTIFVCRNALKKFLGTDYQNLVTYFVAYNLLLIAMKYMVAPLTLNRVHSGIARALSVRTFLQNLLGAFVVAFVVFLIYYTIFVSIRHINAKRSEVLKKEPGGLKVPLGLILSFIFLASIIFGGISGFAFLALLLVESSSQYLSTIFTSGYTYLLVALIVASIVLGAITYRRAIELTDARKNPAIYTNLALLGTSLIVIYHVVWIFFLSVTISLWPIEVFESVFR